MGTLFAPERLTVIGHRGLGTGLVELGGSSYRENSIAGLLRAGELPDAWVELDVHVSSDQRLVLLHDEVLPGNRPAGALNSSELVGLGAELLDDLLRLLPTSVGVVIEVKPSLTDLSASRVPSAHLVANSITVDALRSPGRQVLVYGEAHSLPLALARIRAQRNLSFGIGLFAERDASLMALTSAAIEFGVDVVAAHTSSFLGRWAGPPYCAATPAEVIAAGHAAGVQYAVYVPSAADSALLGAIGVDAVCVDQMFLVQEHLASLPTPVSAVGALL